MDPFIGEIRLFAGNYAPRGWAFCDGQTIAISQNTALYSILGTTYGGDGVSNFALPDLRGRASMHQGQGTGLTPRTLGGHGGITSVTLSESEMPNHRHDPKCLTTSSTPNPIGAVWSNVPSGKGSKAAYNDIPNTTMSPQALEPTGGNNAHNNMQPYLGLNFIIAVQGTYPAHS